VDLYSRIDINIRGHYVYERSSIHSLFFKQLLNDTTERRNFFFVLLVFSLKTAGSKRLTGKVELFLFKNQANDALAASTFELF
jgi:hypothetical protein